MGSRVELVRNSEPRLDISGSNTAVPVVGERKDAGTTLKAPGTPRSVRVGSDPEVRGDRKWEQRFQQIGCANYHRTSANDERSRNVF